MDHTMKIFDIRNNKKPLEAIYGLENNLPGCKLAFSPDEKYILTGTSYDNKENQGCLKFFDSTDYKEVASLNMGKNSVTDIKWHANLN